MSLVVTDTEQIRASIRNVQRQIQGPTCADFWGAEFRSWVGIAADILCAAIMADQKEQFHAYIQHTLGGQRGDWMCEFIDQVFEDLSIELIDQLWP